MNSLRQLFRNKIFSLTIPGFSVKSLTIPWQLSTSLTFPGFPDKWSPCLCPCGKTQTMFHIVKSCPLTKLNGGLSWLHFADEDAVSWLTSYGSWHAYEKKKIASCFYFPTSPILYSYFILGNCRNLSRSFHFQPECGWWSLTWCQPTSQPWHYMPDHTSNRTFFLFA